QMLAALAGRSLDAALLGEPSATEAVRVGLGVAVLGDDEIDPGRQHAGLVAAGAFAADRPHALRAFLRAYLRGVRDHEDAVQDGRFAGDKADAVVAILAAATYVKDAALLRALRPAPLDPDGAPDMARLKEDLALWRARGLIEGVVDAPLAVDASFIEDTLGRLGRYRR
ncbi:MAG: tauA, partial [Hyphomicrobiales bacterium]|nr:tauA [Hyphomicrobiales bacterium]